MSLKTLTDNKFWFDNGCTATGKETRRTLSSKDPHSPLAARSRSQPARLLLAAKREDPSALESLTKFLGEQILNHGQQNNWSLKGRQEALAGIVLFPFVHGQSMSERAAAKEMGVCRGAFNNNWRKKIEVIRPWVQQWAAEIGQAPVVSIVDLDEKG